MGFDRRNIKGRWHNGSLTQNAGTAIKQVIPPKRFAKTVLAALRYVTAGTAHTLQVLRCQGATVTTAAAAASATSLVLDNKAPAKDMNGTSLAEDLASGDYLIVEHTDGTFGAYLVSALSGSTVTIDALAKAVAAGAQVFAMYEISRTTGIPAIPFLTTASTTEEFPTAGADNEMGCAMSKNQNEPLLIYSNNATAAGTIKFSSAIYVDM